MWSLTHLMLITNLWGGSTISIQQMRKQRIRKSKQVGSAIKKRMLVYPTPEPGSQPGDLSHYDHESGAIRYGSQPPQWPPVILVYVYHCLV